MKQFHVLVEGPLSQDLFLTNVTFEFASLVLLCAMLVELGLALEQGIANLTSEREKEITYYALKEYQNKHICIQNEIIKFIEQLIFCQSAQSQLKQEKES